MSIEEYEKKGNEPIGRGSYGEVWLAKHKKDKKMYVLKIMDLRNASKRERMAAEQEAKLLGAMKHPNIVAYRDSFEGKDGFLYIAMGFCEGGDLYSRLKLQKSIPLEESQIVEWFVQIAMALQYMHEKKIMHRDLKTQNIFLTKSKIIKVGDLGIARVLESASDMSTTLIGTPYYMSPEIFSNKPYNFKSDVWALGCCVYEMVTLRHAFNAKDMNALVYKVLRGRMPPMPDIYRVELVNLIKAMLNKNPEKRPSVNRILRDPYIKENIAIFLDRTKQRAQENRPSTAEDRRGSGSRPGSEPRGAGGNVRSSAPSSIQSRNGKVEENLEPLHFGPELEAINEEPTPRESVDVNTHDSVRRNSNDRIDRPRTNSESSQQQITSPSAVLSDGRGSGEYPKSVCEDEVLDMQRNRKISPPSNSSNSLQSSENKSDVMETSMKRLKRIKEKEKLASPQKPAAQGSAVPRSQSDSCFISDKVSDNNSHSSSDHYQYLSVGVPYSRGSDSELQNKHVVQSQDSYRCRDREGKDLIVPQIDSQFTNGNVEKDVSDRSQSTGMRSNRRRSSGSSAERHSPSSGARSSHHRHGSSGSGESVERQSPSSGPGSNRRRDSGGERVDGDDVVDIGRVRPSVSRSTNDLRREEPSPARPGRALPLPTGRSVNNSSPSAYKVRTKNVQSTNFLPIGASSPVSKCQPVPSAIISSSSSSSSSSSNTSESFVSKSRREDAQVPSAAVPVSCRLRGPGVVTEEEKVHRNSAVWSRESGYASISSSVGITVGGVSETVADNNSGGRYVDAQERWNESPSNGGRESSDSFGRNRKLELDASRDADVKQPQTPRRSDQTPKISASHVNARDRRRLEKEQRERQKQHMSVELSNVSDSSFVSRTEAARLNRSEADCIDGIVPPRRVSSSSEVNKLEYQQPRPSPGIAPVGVGVDAKNRKKCFESPRSSSSSESSPDADDVPEIDQRRNDKEINSFINLLDTTLHMPKPSAKNKNGSRGVEDDDDDEEDGELETEVEDALPAPRPWGSPGDVNNKTYVMLAPSKLPGNVNYPVIGTVRPPAPVRVNPAAAAPTQNALESGVSMTTTGCLLGRIAMLRKDCIHRLGVAKLKKAFDILDQFDSEEMEPRLIDLLGETDFDMYAGKIWQLKFCEESMYGFH